MQCRGGGTDQPTDPADTHGPVIVRRHHPEESHAYFDSVGSNSTGSKTWRLDPTYLYLTGSMRCSYGVPAHMTYGFAVFGFWSRG